MSASLNEAAPWSFRMPNEAFDLAIQPFRYAWIFSVTDDVQTLEGGGVILGITDEINNRDNKVMVFGFDLLFDLGRIIVDETEVSEKKWTSPVKATINTISGTEFVLDALVDGDFDTIDFVQLNPVSGDLSWLYLGHEAPFAAARYTLRPDGLYFNNTESEVTAEPFGDLEWGWAPLDSDTTVIDDVPWAQDGVQRWTRNNRELMVRHSGQNLYWVRLFATEGTNLFVMEEIEIEIDWVTDTDVDTIMGYATGWSVTYGVGGRVGKVAYSVRRESVLLCLVRSAEMTNESFRLQTPGEREVHWLGAGWESSGITAVPVELWETAPPATTCMITRLVRKRDYTELVTRCYPLGNGNDGAQVDLSRFNSDDLTIPTGFTVDVANNLIINTALETALGNQRLMYWEFPEIAPLSGASGQSRANSLALAQAALARLTRAEGDTVHYDLELEALPERIKPGETVDVVYGLVDVDGLTRENINETLVVTQTTKRLLGDGQVQWSLSVSSTGVHLLTPERMAANEQRRLAARVRHPSPVSISRVSGYTVIPIG